MLKGKSMKNKYTRNQIENAICRWSKYLLESKLASEDEVKHVIGEGFFKRAKTAIKSLGQHTAKGIKSLATQFHDAFCANKGMAKLMDAVEKIMKKNYRAKDINVYVKIDRTVYPVVKFTFTKNLKEEFQIKTPRLILVHGKKGEKPQTFKDLLDLTTELGITGGKTKKRHITDVVDGIIVAKLPEDGHLDESIRKNDVSRIRSVLDAMGWKKFSKLNKDAKSKRIQKLKVLFSLKDGDENELVELMKTYDDERDSEAGKDAEPSSSGSKTGKDAEPSSSSSSGSDSEHGTDDSPSFEKPEKFDVKSLDEYLIKTTEGDEIVALRDVFKDVMTEGRNIAVCFDSHERMRELDAVKH